MQHLRGKVGKQRCLRRTGQPEGCTRAHSGTLGQPPFAQTNSLHHGMTGQGKGKGAQGAGVSVGLHDHQGHHGHP